MPELGPAPHPPVQHPLTRPTTSVGPRSASTFQGANDRVLSGSLPGASGCIHRGQDGLAESAGGIEQSGMARQLLHPPKLQLAVTPQRIPRSTAADASTTTTGRPTGPRGRPPLRSAAFAAGSESRCRLAEGVDRATGARRRSRGAGQRPHRVRMSPGLVGRRAGSRTSSMSTLHEERWANVSPITPDGLGGHVHGP